ncbi:MAG: CzcE family metal-binding protein [Rhodoferax sp.]|nr:CzcE family metal-binding protein [Rhodoferax sp.]
MSNPAERCRTGGDALSADLPASNTERVDVTGGESIKFTVGGQSFAWKFDGSPGVNRVDLKRIAPVGLLDRSVIAYVAPNEVHIGGGGHGANHRPGRHGGAAK